MKKTEYLAQLDRYLKKLPKTDYQEAMDYFNEYFDEAGPGAEEEVIADLGTPKEAAHDIISNLLNKEFDKNVISPKRSKKEVILLIILGILAAPIALPILLFMLAMLVTAIILIFAFLFTLSAFSLTGFLASGVFFYESFANLSGNFAGFSIGFGLALGALGGALLLALLTITFSRWGIILIKKSFTFMIKRRK